MKTKGLKKEYERLLKAIKAHYGRNLVSVCIYGSQGRGTATVESDTDLFIVVEKLPRSRLKRTLDFIENVEDKVRDCISSELSVIIRTPEEVLRGSPILLDMVEDAVILHDRNGFMKKVLKDLKKRLEKLGARRVWKGNMWYWDLRPGYKIGEVFEI